MSTLSSAYWIVQDMTVGHQVAEKLNEDGPKFACCLAVVSMELLSTSVSEHLNVLQMQSYTYLIHLYIPDLEITCYMKVIPTKYCM
jgi:hypothetical protein